MGGLRTPGRYTAARRVTKRETRHIYRAVQPGFTVIEVLIVMAVSGLLLVGAIVMIGGKQNQTAFDQSIRQVQSQIQQRINDVATGFYDNEGNIRCNGTGGVVTLTAGSGTEQGANAGCVFIGKALQFKVGASDPEQFNVFSIAGLQKGGPGGTESSTLLLAKPKTIAPSSTASGIPDATETQTLQNGLTTYRMWYNNGGADKPIGGVAFVMSLAQYSSSGAIASGSQQIDVVPIDDSGAKSALGKQSVDLVDAINSNLASSPINPSNGVFICFTSAGTNQSGLITIGNQSRQLSVKLDIKGNKTCS